MAQVREPVLCVDVPELVCVCAALPHCFCRVVTFLFCRGMLEEGVYLAPSQFEAGFTGLAHTDADIDATIEAAKRVFARI